MLFPVTLTSILFTLLLIILCCLIMAKYRDVFEKVRLPFLVLTLVGGLTVYTLGYLPETLVNGQTTGLDRVIEFGSVMLRALFSTCRSFILESDFSEVRESLKQSNLYVLAVNTVHVMALLLTVLTVLSLFGMRFISRIQLLMAKDKDVYLFYGLQDASYHLLQDIRKNGRHRTILVVESIPDDRDEESKSLFKKIRENQCILLQQNPSDVSGFKKLGIPGRLLRKNLHCFLLFDDENLNMRSAVRIMEEAKKEGIAQNSVTLHVQTVTMGMEKILEKIKSDHGLRMEFKTFSIPDITARQLFESCPVYETLELDTSNATAKSDFNMLIAGFGSTGEEVLRKSLYCGQFKGGSYSADVVDHAADCKVGRFNNRYPGVAAQFDIRYHELDTGSREFYDLLAMKGPSLNYIVICLGSDRQNMDIALEVQRLVHRNCIRKDALIAVHIVKPEDYTLYRNAPDLPNIRFFGGLSRIFTEAIIINESMDKMARKMNEMFNAIYHMEPADNWSGLDAFTKESNRSAAMNIRTKLRLMGLDMAEKGSGGRKTAALEDYLSGIRLDHLARQEHMRWNAFHFASGWLTWALSDTGDAKKAKDPALKRHACLVSWEELAGVTARFNQQPSYEELDYQQVRHIPAILDFAGYEVYAVIDQ